MIKSKYLSNEEIKKEFCSGKTQADVKVSLAKFSTKHIVSKDNAKCFYDLAEEYYKIVEYFEKVEKRKPTQEALIIMALLDIRNE